MLRRLESTDTALNTGMVAASKLTRRIRLGILTGLALVMLLSSSLVALAGPTSQGFIVDGARMESAKRVEPLAVVELDNGDRVMFTPLPDDRGRTASVLVSGVRSSGRAPIQGIDGLRDANPLEIFVAISKPGQKVPAILAQLYGGGEQLQHQGWARDMVITTDPQLTSCPAIYFQNQLADFADDFNHDDPFTSSWDGPNTIPGHWSGASNAPADGNVYYDLHGQANSVTAFYGAVLYCVEDYENASIFDGNYVGNHVVSHFRVAGTGSWIYSAGGQLDDVGDIYEHIYSPGNRFSPGATKYDFHIEIQTAKPDDQFHIGATWVYGGPSGIKSGG